MPTRPVRAMPDPLPQSTSHGAHVHGRGHGDVHDGVHGHGAGGDGAGSVDQLIARVARRLGDAHTQLPREQLQRMAEEVVLDTVRFVLHWVESPASGSAPFRDAPDDDEPTPPPSKPGASETAAGLASAAGRPRWAA